MGLEAATEDQRKSARLARITWLAWLLLTLIAAWVELSRVGDHPVNEAYADGAKRWLKHKPLYGDDGTGFIYLPHSAILYIPFTKLPRVWAEALWRITTIGLFAAGVWRLAQLGDAGPRGECFFLISLIVLPKTWTNAFSGQATPAMAGLMMLAAADLATQKWSRATVLLLAAVAFKPLAIVPLLLAAAMYRPMQLRTAIGIALFAALPYLVAGAPYVSSQYVAAAEMLTKAVAKGLQLVWAQFFSLIALVGVRVPALSQTLVRLAAAVLTLALGLAARQRFTMKQTAVYYFALSAAYILLFNPRSENNTYVLLAPAAGMSFAQALRRSATRGMREDCVITATRTGGEVIPLSHARPRWRVGLVWSLAREANWRAPTYAIIGISLTAGFEICKFLTPNAGFVWLCPLLCLVYAGDLAWTISRAPESAEPRGRVADRTSEPLEVPVSTSVAQLRPAAQRAVA